MGELHWRDVDLDAGELTVTCRLVQIGWRTEMAQLTYEFYKLVQENELPLTRLRRTSASTLAAFLAHADKTLQDNGVQRDDELDHDRSYRTAGVCVALQ